ncbi:MAG: hypothetical protein QOH41_3978 [Blastocatellia bacterium]|nr:hypothetical protein [Blastocatellia bacterium]
MSHESSTVTLFWLPSRRTDRDAKRSVKSFENIATYCGRLDESATVCILTTAPDAAFLLSFLKPSLKLQLWVAVKTISDPSQDKSVSVTARHAALLILTRYKAALRHAPTRIKYTYCPACRKTTKDYGGKKHMYHGYGTLMSDVWTDIECDPSEDISPVTERLRDLFGITPYDKLSVIDLRQCEGLIPVKLDALKVRSLRGEDKGDKPTRTVRSRLTNKDCIEGLKSLRPNSIDFCFADLPYNLRKKYYRSKDSRSVDEYFEWCNEWLFELDRVLKPGHTLAVLNVPQWAANHFAFLSSKMEFQAWIVWDALALPARRIMPAHYAILCFSKGSPRELPGLKLADDYPELNYLRPRKELYCVRASCVRRRKSSGCEDYSQLTDLWSDIHRLTHNSQRVNHPCQLPPSLMRRLFALFTEPNEIVLDCLNGAGTSTLVAEEMSRRYIGIELSKRYHNLAVKRHKLLKSRQNPFASSNETPRSKNSPVARLPKRKYKVSKKDLQLDVRRIANMLGRVPKREDVEKLSSFSIRYFDQYFVSWAEACAAARTTGMMETVKTEGAYAAKV